MKKILLTLTFLLSFNFSEAAIRLSPLLADGMVLQRDSEVKLWGKASPLKKIKVIPSWDSRKYMTKADADGNWSVQVATAGAGGPYSIRISDGEERILEDILLGDVWVCSGQSNMEHPVAGYPGQPVEHSLETIIDSEKYRDIRVFTVKKTAATEPEEEVEGQWEIPSVTATPHFSATAYFFARSLQDVLDIPIGIVHTSWGGATIETWLDRKTLEKYPHFNPSAIDITAKKPQYRPTMCYNSMLYPLRHLTVKGFTWFQGESNVGAHQTYPGLFKDLVCNWRKLFQHAGEAPFYFVQLTPYGSSQKDRTAFFREAQTKCLQIPGTGMAVTMDIGHPMIVHISEKEVVGQRLAYQALAKTYGMDIPCDGPLFRKATVENGRIYVSFDHDDGGLCPMMEPLGGFEIAGKDGKYLPAKARIGYDGRLAVWSDEIGYPVYVRYGFRNYIEGTLYNAYHLPAVPFRTDHFDPVK